MTKNKVIIPLVFAALPLIYFGYINFNLPFMTDDELFFLVRPPYAQLQDIVAHGRVSHFFGTVISQLLNFRAPTPLELIPRFFSMVALFVSLIIYLRHIGLSLILSALLGGLILMAHQVDWQNNGFVAFFGGYNVYLALFLIAIVLHEKQNKKRYINFFVYLLLLLSYSSEVFVGLSFIYLLSYFLIYKKKIQEIIFSPFFAAIASYILLYVTVFLASGSLEPGTPSPSGSMRFYLSGSVDSFAFYQIIQGTLMYVANSLPYFVDLHYNQTTTTIVGVLIVSIAGFVAYKIFVHFIQSGSQQAKYRQLLLHSIIWISLLVLPQFLISLQPMKLNWLLSGASNRYVFALYSWIAICLLAIVFMAANKTNKKLVSMSIFLLFLFASFSAYSNIKYITPYREFLDKWQKIDIRFKESSQKQSAKIPAELMMSTGPAPFGIPFIRDYGKFLYDTEVLICTSSNYYDFGTPLDEVVTLKGFSITPEANGRWTDQKVATVQFPQKLYSHQFIKIILSDLFGENRNLPTLFKIGSNSQKITIGAKQEVMIEILEDIENPILEINIPHPISPFELGVSGDNRKLGIKIKSIQAGTLKEGIIQLEAIEFCK